MKKKAKQIEKKVNKALDKAGLPYGASVQVMKMPDNIDPKKLDKFMRNFGKKMGIDIIRLEKGKDPIEKQIARNLKKRPLK